MRADGHARLFTLRERAGTLLRFGLVSRRLLCGLGPVHLTLISSYARGQV